MHDTPVRVKDVEFASYLRPSVHGDKAVLQLSFRLHHMQTDELILDIQQDEENALYTTDIQYYIAHEDQQLNLTTELDEEEMHELLKAVLNSQVAQSELSFYGMSEYEGCYAKKPTDDFEVMIVHVDTAQKEGDVSRAPQDEIHLFSSKRDAFHFFHQNIYTYTQKSTEAIQQTFGAYKVLWEHKEVNADILTYISLHYQGNEIDSKEKYNAL